MKTYKINGKEISEAYEGLHVSGDYLAGKINQLLEALSDNNDECNCCGWDDHGYTHEPGCNLKKALSDKEEEKQSTSLKEDRNSLKYQVSYLLWNENNFTKEETDKYSEKILSLVKSHLVKEIKGKLVYSEGRDCEIIEKEDIIKIISNISK